MGSLDGPDRRFLHPAQLSAATDAPDRRGGLAAGLAGARRRRSGDGPGSGFDPLAGRSLARRRPARHAGSRGRWPRSRHRCPALGPDDSRSHPPAGHRVDERVPDACSVGHGREPTSPGGKPVGTEATPGSRPCIRSIDRTRHRSGPGSSQTDCRHNNRGSCRDGNGRAATRSRPTLATADTAGADRPSTGRTEGRGGPARRLTLAHRGTEARASGHRRGRGRELAVLVSSQSHRHRPRSRTGAARAGTHPTYGRDGGLICRA